MANEELTFDQRVALSLGGSVPVAPAKPEILKLGALHRLLEGQHNLAEDTFANPTATKASLAWTKWIDADAIIDAAELARGYGWQVEVIEGDLERNAAHVRFSGFMAGSA